VWVVVGIGNPGRRYARTRHDVGFRVVDRLAARWGVPVTREVHGALVGRARRGVAILLVKPQMFMNYSGDPVGRLRVRTSGGSGGHRGVASMIERLGGGGFVRLRIGVGRPAPGLDTTDYVLGVPAVSVASALDESEGRAADAVEMLIADGPGRTMNHVNQREASHGGSPL
jgi:PTH1 family peptidyl-tRNA hydrolase